MTEPQDDQDLKVEIVEKLGEPTTCKVWRNGVLVFDGQDRSASMTQLPAQKYGLIGSNDTDHGPDGFPL